MSIISNSRQPKIDDGAARQALKETARTLSRSRSVWHFMAWSFVVAETAGREAQAVKHGDFARAGDIDLSKIAITDVTTMSAGQLADNVYLADLDQGPFSETAVVHAGKNGDAHFDAVLASGAGVPALEVSNILAATDTLQRAGAVFETASHAVSSSFVSYSYYTNLNWMPGGNHWGGGPGPVMIHEPPPAGHLGGPGSGQPIPGLPGTGVPAAYDGPPILYASGISPFSDKIGLGVKADAISGAAPAVSQGPVTAAMQFTSNAFAPAGAWGGLGSNDQPNGLHAGDRADVHYLIQANGYGSLGSSQLQLTNTATDSATSLQQASPEAKSASNSAVLIDDGGEHPLFIKGSYYEYNTIIQINITANDDAVSVTRTGFGTGGTSHGPLLINTGDNQQHNAAVITDTPHPDQAVQQASDPAQVTSPGDPASQTSPATTSPAQVNSVIDDGPHTVVMGPISQHYAVVQISQVLNADTLSFNFDDVIRGNATDLSVAKFADVNAGGDVQTNSSLISFSNPISQAGYTAHDFIKAHSGSHVEVINGDYYKINTIFQLNLALDSNSISKTVGDNLSAAGISNGGFEGGVLASGGNIELNTASIIKNNFQDMYVGGKYTQYNLVLQINAMADSSQVTQTSAVTHDGPQPTDAFALGTDHGHSGHNNGSDGGVSSSSLPNPLDELALRGGQTIDHSI